MELQGCFTALATPFRNGEVDYEALRKLVQEQIAAGVAGIVPVGTTGESPTITFEEHPKVIETVLENTDGKCTVIAGTGANSTQEAVELTRVAAKAGADATLQVTPYYNKPTQEGLYQHFTKVADEGGLPVVLYNVPGRTGKEIEVQTILRLAKHPQICAVKEATPDLDRISHILGQTDGITILSGDDSLTLPRMSVGAVGVISVASNVVPSDVNSMVQAALQGDLPQAQAWHRRLFPLFRDLFLETNPIPVKAALAMTGRIAEEYRLPLCEMAAENRAALRRSLQEYGLLN